MEIFERYKIENLDNDLLKLEDIASNIIKSKNPASYRSKIKNKEQSSNFSDQMQKQMMYFMPVLTVLILLRLPSAIGFYWIVSTVFTIVQQHVILRKKNHGSE